MADRHDTLLRQTAEAYEGGRDPFSTEWLSEHEVTFGECVDLANKIAVLIKGYLNSPRTTQMTILFAGAADGTPLGDAGSVAFVKAQIDADAAMKQLGARRKP